MKTPRFQLSRRARLRIKLRNLVALEAERQWALLRHNSRLEKEMDAALIWQEREILDSVYPTLKPTRRKAAKRDGE